jgi:hypothetical protein
MDPMHISEPASSLVTFELPAFTDRNGKKHNARYCYTSVSAKNGAVRVRWVHAGSSGQRRTRLLSTNPLLEEAPLSYLQHLEVCEPKHYAELLHATFGTAPTGTMQKVFSALLAEHLSCADKRGSSAAKRARREEPMATLPPAMTSTTQMTAAKAHAEAMAAALDLSPRSAKIMVASALGCAAAAMAAKSLPNHSQVLGPC